MNHSQHTHPLQRGGHPGGCRHLVPAAGRAHQPDLCGLRNERLFPVGRPEFAAPSQGADLSPAAMSIHHHSPTKTESVMKTLSLAVLAVSAALAQAAWAADTPATAASQPAKAATAKHHSHTMERSGMDNMPMDHASAPVAADAKHKHEHQKEKN